MIAGAHDDEEVKRVALQNAKSILQARQRAEEDLRRHTEWLRTTLASMGDAVISTDPQGRVNFMNLVAESLTGWSQVDVLGLPITEVFRISSGDASLPMDNPALEALRTGATGRTGGRPILAARDGTERFIDGSAAPIRSDAGELVGSVLVFRDVSSVHQAELERRCHERDLADFFDNANVGLHRVGPDGIILRVNQAEVDMLGYRSDEYVGHHIAEFHVDRSVIDDMLTRLGAGETLQGVPAQLRCKDGSVRDVLINSSGLFDEGRFIHTRCCTLDVTDRNRVHIAQGVLAAIVETSDDAILSKTLEGVIRSWNPGGSALVRLFGPGGDRQEDQHDYSGRPARRRAINPRSTEARRAHRALRDPVHHEGWSANRYFLVGISYQGLRRANSGGVKGCERHHRPKTVSGRTRIAARERAEREVRGGKSQPAERGVFGNLVA